MRGWGCPLCTKPTRLDGFYSVKLTDRNNAATLSNVAKLGHIISIPSQPVFALCCVLRGE